MKAPAALFLFAVPALCTAQWTPPAQPEPRAILAEAERDTQARRYDDALSRLVWFHRHALDLAPELYALRLSRALQDWAALARVYPPALQALRAQREAAAAQVRQEQDPRRDFNEVLAIDRVLGEEGATRALFLWLDAQRPEAAAKVYEQAQAALVRAHDYAVCGKYLSPDKTLARIIEQYRLTLDLAEGAENAPALREFARHTLSNQAGLLVALLVQNHRRDDAGRIAAAALRAWDDAGFRDLLGQALSGSVPEPWPL